MDQNQNFQNQNPNQNPDPNFQNPNYQNPNFQNPNYMPPQPPMGPVNDGKGMSIAALVCGILGIIGGFIPIVTYFTTVLAILGLIFGVIGRKKSTLVYGKASGLATAGLVLGVIACEAVEKSKKLLCSQVRIGSQVKQIVSGIRKHYAPEEMVGKKVMVLVNLKPAKLAGVLSEGMILLAEDAEGNLALMTPEKYMPAGAEIC